MPTLTQRDTDIMAGSDIQATVAQHNAEIAALGGRMSGVETGLRTLQSEVHTGFAGINNIMHKLDSKIDSFGQRPQFNFHQTVSTVTTLAVLFSMIVGGIIYIIQQQNAVVLQSVSSNSTDVNKMKDDVQTLKEKFGWSARIDKGAR